MKLARVLTIVFACTSLLTLVACGPKYPNCDSDKQCKEKGEYCYDKKCVKCIDDSHCAQMGPCGKCSPNHECKLPLGEIGDCCSLDNDCRSKHCLVAGGAETGKCVQCKENPDCGSGMKCVNNSCVPDVECSSDTDCGQGRKCDGGKCVVDLCKLRPAYFDFDEYELRTDSREALDKSLACMKERGIETISIEGHCDDRGSDEYNLALGNRRSAAAKKYLKKMGVKDKSVSTISYGEERPTCMDATESCWSKNRRAEIVEK